jgi:predicted negative regulator of RcsB-dependent stress response
MKNKNIHQQYQEIIDSIKAEGKAYIQEEIENLESDFKGSTNIYTRMGLLGQIQLHEKALKQLLDAEESLEILDEAFATHA